MRIIIYILLTVCLCLVSAKYLPDETHASRALLSRHDRSVSDDSAVSKEQHDDDDDDDGEDSVERKITEEHQKRLEKIEKESQKRLEKQQEAQRKLEEYERKVQKKRDEEERKQQERIEKHKQKEEEKRKKHEEEQRKLQERREKEELKRQEEIRKRNEKVEVVNAVSTESTESTEDDSLSLEDIWKNHVYNKYSLTATSTKLEKKAAVYRYLQEELGLNANSTKSERRQAIINFIQNTTHSTDALDSFRNHLISHVNAASIQQLQANLERKLEKLNNESTILQNINLPWAAVAQNNVEEKRTLLHSVTQFLAGAVPNSIRGEKSTIEGGSNAPGSQLDALPSAELPNSLGLGSPNNAGAGSDSKAANPVTTAVSAASIPTVAVEDGSIHSVISGSGSTNIASADSTKTIAGDIGSTNAVAAGVPLNNPTRSASSSPTNTTTTGVQSTNTAITDTGLTDNINVGSLPVNTDIAAGESIHSTVSNSGSTTGSGSTDITTAGIQSTNPIITGIGATDNVNVGFESDKNVASGAETSDKTAIGTGSTDPAVSSSTIGNELTNNIATGAGSTDGSTVEAGSANSIAIDTGASENVTVNSGLPNTVITGTGSTNIVSTVPTLVDTGAIEVGSQSTVFSDAGSSNTAGVGFEATNSIANVDGSSYTVTIVPGLINTEVAGAGLTNTNDIGSIDSATIAESSNDHAVSTIGTAHTVAVESTNNIASGAESTDIVTFESGSTNAVEGASITGTDQIVTAAEGVQLTNNGITGVNDLESTNGIVVESVSTHHAISDTNTPVEIKNTNTVATDTGTTNSIVADAGMINVAVGVEPNNNIAAEVGSNDGTLGSINAAQQSNTISAAENRPPELTDAFVTTAGPSDSFINEIVLTDAAIGAGLIDSITTSFVSTDTGATSTVVMDGTPSAAVPNHSATGAQIANTGVGTIDIGSFNNTSVDIPLTVSAADTPASEVGLPNNTVTSGSISDVTGANSGPVDIAANDIVGDSNALVAGSIVNEPVQATVSPNQINTDIVNLVPMNGVTSEIQTEANSVAAALDTNVAVNIDTTVANIPTVPENVSLEGVPVPVEAGATIVEIITQ